MPPERIGFSAELAEKLAFWTDFHRALETLWLDSGEYESWARAQLENHEAPVNARGLRLVEELNKYHRTSYWWFQDTTVADFTPFSQCPRCSRELGFSFNKSVCDVCSIVVPNL